MLHNFIKIALNFFVKIFVNKKVKYTSFYKFFIFFLFSFCRVTYFIKNYFNGKVTHTLLQPVNYNFYHKRFIKVIIYRT